MFNNSDLPSQWQLRRKPGVSSDARSSTDQALEESDLSSRVLSLQKETGLSALTLRVCIQRGLETAEAIRAFLSPRFDQLKSPWTLMDMELAVTRLVQAKEQGEAVRIYGDYDVDGTAGAALLSWVFREFGLSFDATQPDRFKDGYGLNSGAVEQAAQDGIRVLVTVDCGITSFAAANRAKELGIDLIIVDHHSVDPVQGIPIAHAVVNPQRQDCPSGLKQLCGCGLAFYLAMALRSRGRDRGWFQGQAEPNLKQHLDLVVMATAADMVPLTGDNHVLVRYGLQVLKFSKKPGVQALLEAAGLKSKDVSPSHLGFVLGPRINASGRMQSASTALELLTTQDLSRATELALAIEKMNHERAFIQNQIWDEVRALVEKGLSEGKYKHGIVVAHSDWHEGVVGIVASRVTENFRKPAVVIALREDFGKGSVRSYGGKSVLEGLRRCSSHLLGFGGHKFAAGLSLSHDQMDAFTEAFDKAMGEIPSEKNAGVLLMDGVCLVGDLDIKTLQELEQLGPFGTGNPEPVFVVRGAMKNHRVLKGRHLKFSLSAIHSSGIEAIWFHAAEKEEVMTYVNSVGEEREWAGVPELNRFRGQVTPSFRVREWRSLES